MEKRHKDILRPLVAGLRRTLAGTADGGTTGRGDLDRALEGSTALREHFGRVALTGLMLLRHPLGRRRRVGGRDWGSRRLYDQVVHADPEFVLVRQARREMHEECDVEAGRIFAEELNRRAICCRWLARCSPLAECWASAER